MSNDSKRTELLERRAFLLRSIDDLDREHAAGDLSEADFALLHDDYSRRAAAVQREIDSGVEPSPAKLQGSPLRSLLVVFGIASFAVTSAVLVTRIAGERKGSDGLTGSIQAATINNSDAKVASLLQSGRDNLTSNPTAAIKAFDEAAKLDPTQAEAFAYSGWVMRLVALGVDDDTQRALLFDGALRRFDDAIKADPRYPDVRAFRGVHMLRDRNDAREALRDFVALQNLQPSTEIEQLVGSARIDAENQVAEENAQQSKPATSPSAPSPSVP